MGVSNIRSQNYNDGHKNVYVATSYLYQYETSKCVNMYLHTSSYMYRGYIHTSLYLHTYIMIILLYHWINFYSNAHTYIDIAAYTTM